MRNGIRSTSGQVPGLRQFKTGLYYASGGDTSLDATFQSAVNTAYAAPFVVGAGTAFDRISCEVTLAAGVAAVGRLVIYNSTLGYPSTILLDAGTIDPTTSGPKERTISQVLPAGLYWLGYVTDATPPAPQLRSRGDTSIYVGHTSNGNANRAGFSCAAVAGAAPSPFSTTVTTESTTPKIMLRAA